MKHRGMLPFRSAFCGLALLSIVYAAGPDGLNAEYCSHQNTGADYDSGEARNMTIEQCFGD